MKQSYFIRGLLIAILLFDLSKVYSQAISAGAEHSLFICSDKKVMSSGQNYHGQLGTGSLAPSSTPVTISSLTDIVSVSAGEHSLFLKSDSTVWACGNNLYGQCGVNSTINISTPLQIPTLTKVIAIEAGTQHSLFLKSDSTVWACGNKLTTLNTDGSSTGKLIPYQISQLSGIKAIDASSGHSFYLKGDGSVWANGNNGLGDLGLGVISSTNVPTKINNLNGIIAVSAGNSHALFLKNDGTVWGTGVNNSGQLGIGSSPLTINTPIQIPNLSNIIAIETHYTSSLFLKNDGTVWGTGFNMTGELGTGTLATVYYPQQIANLSEIVEISGGGGHALFHKSNGAVYGTGAGWANGTPTNNYTATIISGLCSVSVISVNEHESNKSDLKIYPNPSFDVLNLKLEEGKSMDGFSIIDVLGRKVLEQKETGSQINIEGLNKGIYQLLITSEGKSYSSKFIKE